MDKETMRDLMSLLGCCGCCCEEEEGERREARQREAAALPPLAPHLRPEQPGRNTRTGRPEMPPLRAQPVIDEPFVPPPRLTLAPLGSWGQGMVANVGAYLGGTVFGWATTDNRGRNFGSGPDGLSRILAVQTALGGPSSDPDVSLSELGSVVSGAEVLILYRLARQYDAMTGFGEPRYEYATLDRFALAAWNPAQDTFRIVGGATLPRLPLYPSYFGVRYNPELVYCHSGRIQVFLLQQFARGPNEGLPRGSLWVQASAAGVEAGWSPGEFNYPSNWDASPWDDGDIWGDPHWALRIDRTGIGTGGRLMALCVRTPESSRDPPGARDAIVEISNHGLTGTLIRLTGKKLYSGARSDLDRAGNVFTDEGLYVRGAALLSGGRQDAFIPYSGDEWENVSTFNFPQIGNAGDLEWRPEVPRSPVAPVVAPVSIRVTARDLEDGPVTVRVPVELPGARTGDRLLFGNRTFTVGGVSVGAVEFEVAAPLELAEGAALAVDPLTELSEAVQVDAGALHAVTGSNRLARLWPVSADAVTERVPGRWQGRLPPETEPDRAVVGLRRAHLTGFAGDVLRLTFPPQPTGAEWGSLVLVLTYRCAKDVTLTLDGGTRWPTKLALLKTGRHWAQQRAEVAFAPGTSTLTLTTDQRIEVSSAVLDLTGTQGASP